MSDKPFNPVTEGTPELFSAQLYFSNEKDVIALIAARDAAMLKKGEEKGRLKGLEEAAVIIEERMLTLGLGLGNYNGLKLAKEIIRAAAETAKEGE